MAADSASDGRHRRLEADPQVRLRPGAVNMQLMIADVDEPPWIRVLLPLERGGHALIRHAGKDDERETADERKRDVPCAVGEDRAHEGSVSASPYFSIRE